MNDKDYSKRELDMKFEKLEEKIDVNHAETMDQLGENDRRNHDKQVTLIDGLGEVKALVTLTNGRVRKLEKWQAGIVMAGSVALFLGGVIVGLIVYIYQYQLAQESIRITNLKALIQNQNQ